MQGIVNYVKEMHPKHLTRFEQKLRLIEALDRFPETMLGLIFLRFEYKDKK